MTIKYPIELRNITEDGEKSLTVPCELRINEKYITGFPRHIILIRKRQKGLAKGASLNAFLCLIIGFQLDIILKHIILSFS